MELQFIFDETNYNALPCRSKSHHERSTDPRYSYQKEFRFFIGECSKGELKAQVLDLPELNELLLDAKSLRIDLPNGSIKFCSVGHKGIVTV
ncbi:hypothetical protein [Vibrio anguillarum]|uniref:hypothetical protein n=1 Tax=Vibrio anguillarum TaxID=55601 RepID=UPI00188D838D|nr:hypothetical protein [Vibrio anguillarum]MBF4241923.1 hypothetical protein [Vibrio anguillarum]